MVYLLKCQLGSLQNSLITIWSEAVPQRKQDRWGQGICIIIMGLTCDRIRQLSLTSYDRFFPNQDTLPSGGFGKLIALPLQKVPRLQCQEKGNRFVSVDDQGNAYTNQWELLSCVDRMDTEQIQALLDKTKDEDRPYDLPLGEETLTKKSKPWENKSRDDQRLTCPIDGSCCQYDLH